MKTQRSLMLMQVIAFGALFISVGQVPQSFMDGWLKVAARYNPITNVLELSRQGFLGDVAWSTTWPGLLALVSMILVSGALAWRGLKRLAP
jgi:ABC-type polysaccharide/polyol phosphate export permease